MKKPYYLLWSSFFFLLTFSLQAQTPDWGLVGSSKDIKKVYTYKNSATYLIFNAGGFAVLDHKTGQSKTFTKFNSKLPSQSLNDIVITEDSTIYLASNGAGLIKIKDGKYESIIADPSTFTSDDISSVSIGPDGDIWFSESGFNLYRITKSGIVKYTSENGATIGGFYKMKFLENNQIWAIGVWGIAYYNGTTWTEHDPFWPSSFTDIEVDEAGTVWITSSSGLLKYSNNNWSKVYNPDYWFSPDDLYLNESNNLIVEDFSSWLEYNTVSGAWTTVSIKPQTSPYESFQLNNNNDLFVTTSTGFVLETKTNTYTLPYKAGFSFKGQVSEFFDDSHGNSWIATKSDGLIRITPDKDTIVYNYNNGLTDSQFYCLEEDKEGKIWVGGPNRLHYFSNDEFHEVKNSTINYYAVNDILVDDDNSLWLASYYGLYHITNGDTVEYTTSNSGLPSNDLRRIVKGKDGAYYIGSYNGLIKFNGTTQWFLYDNTNSGLLSNSINDLELDAFGNIWIGSNHYGSNSLAVFTGSEFKTFDIDPNANSQAYVLDISIDKYGNKWLATQGHGLARFDGNATQYFTKTNSGLPDNNLYAVGISKDDNILVSAYNIIVSYQDPADYLDTTNLRGVVFQDDNKNKVRDNGEQVLPFARLKIWGSNRELYANGAGEFASFEKLGNYLIQSLEEDKWKIEGTIVPVVIEKGKSQNLEIPFTKVAQLVHADVSLSGGFARCNTDVVHILQVKNDGTENQKAVVKLVTASPVSSLYPAPVTVSGDTSEWVLENLQAGQISQIKSIITMPGFDGDFEAFASVEFYDDENKLIGKDSDTLRPVIRCAYDPNDKTSIPAGRGDKNYLLIKDPVEFLIRFQNTGNDTAFNVVVTDTLSSFLNYNSFKLVASSHDVKVSREDSLLVFTFKDILLPDSTTNETKSHGFIRFSILPNADVAENSILENKANIYFDFNPPIITNTTSNTLVTMYPNILTAIQPQEAEAIKVYPNPVKDILHIELKDEPQGSISIYDLAGNLVDRRPAYSKNISINTQDFTSGMYIIKVETVKGVSINKFSK